MGYGDDITNNLEVNITVYHEDMLIKKVDYYTIDVTNGELSSKPYMTTCNEPHPAIVNMSGAFIVK